MYKSTVELEYLRIVNMNLSEMIVFSDSIAATNQKSKDHLSEQLQIRTGQYNNTLLIVEQEKQKYELADETLDAMRFKKNFLITTTAVAAIALVFALTAL